MFRILKFIIILLLLTGSIVAAYAYIGDLNPIQVLITQPVSLDVK